MEWSREIVLGASFEMRTSRCRVVWCGGVGWLGLVQAGQGRAGQVCSVGLKGECRILRKRLGGKNWNGLTTHSPRAATRLSGQPQPNTSYPGPVGGWCVQACKLAS